MTHQSMNLIDFKALLNSHDASINEAHSGGVFPSLASNATDITDSIAENLTRVRLVQFTKNGAEPLVGLFGLLFNLS